MSRELKFRAWNHTFKDMHSDTDCKVYLSAFIKMNNVTVMQFTGLRDKNGVEIYEGDIIATQGNKSVWVVEWGQAMDSDGWAQEHTWGWVKVHLEDSRDSGLDCEKMVKVIGNVYENPELLTK